MNEIGTAITTNSNVALGIAVVVVGAITRLLKSDTKFPIDIPARWQPVIVLVIGQAYAVLQAIVGGVNWKTAVTSGLQVAFLTMGLFDLVIKALFNGDAPWWLAWLLKPSAKTNGEK